MSDVKAERDGLSSLIAESIRLLRGPSRLARIARFAFVGGMGFILDAAVLKTMIFVGLGPTLGRVVSIVAAVTFTWFLHRTLTFAVQKRPTWSEYGHFVLSSLLGMMINYAIYWVATYLGVPLLIALAMGTLVAAVFNYLRYRTILSDGETPDGPVA